jgi:hypothetical protein
MAEKFALNENEALVKNLAASWYKGAGGLNNQTGQMILTSQRLVFCARNRLMTAAVTGPILDQIVKSETIRWQIRTEDIESITSFKRLGLKKNFRLKSKRWAGEEFVFAFNPGSGSIFEDWASKVGLAVVEEEESTSETNVQPLSEKPQGYLLAVAGGILGGLPGLIASPLVLLGLNNILKTTEEKQPNRFKMWALIGIVGAPICLGLQGAMIGTNTSTTSNTGTSYPEETQTPAPVVTPETWDSGNKKASLEEAIKGGMQSTATGAEQAPVQSVKCTATEVKPIWHCSIRTLGDREATTYRIEVAEDGSWAGQPL